MSDVPIHSASIRLGQLLKLAGIAEDGAHAKELLAGHKVTVNGERDARRGRQLVPGDVVTIAGRTITVVAAD